MANKNLKTLLGNKPSPSAPLTKRIPVRVLQQIHEDIEAISQAEQAGEVIPTAERIVQYLATEYGEQIGQSTVRRWLATLRAGGSIR